jgi:YhcG PDDEXK nuclease domain
MNETANQGSSTRASERQIGTLYYERLLSSSDRAAVEQEATTDLAPLQQRPREFVRDPVMLEFLSLPGTGKLLEADLEQGLLDNLQAFLLELGKGWSSSRIGVEGFILVTRACGSQPFTSLSYSRRAVVMTVRPAMDCRASGMFHSWISKTESGDRRLDVMELILLADLYGKPPEFFLKG